MNANLRIVLPSLAAVFALSLPAPAGPEAKPSMNAPAAPAAAPAAPAAAPAAPLKEHAITAPARLGVLAPNTGVPVGSKVPDAKARDLEGKEVSLASIYAKGPVLLLFYRGGWCPYCNSEIHSMATAYPEYQKRGVTPVAVSVDLPENSSKTKASWSIPFPVLSDNDAATLDAFHVSRVVEGKELGMLKGYGIDLESASGKAHHKIAIPSIFLIDRGGVVRWAHSDPEYKVRPSTAQLLAAIDAAKL